MHFYGKTDVGRRREMNQDVFGLDVFDAQTGYGLVCDGMGGQSAGNIASDMACKAITARIKEAIKQKSHESPRSILASAIREANYSVYKCSMVEPDYHGMGTTAVVAFVSGGVAYCAHVGDSRIYLLRGGTLTQVTRDHSLVQELMESGQITPEQMRTHPRRNMITRAVGVGLTVEPDLLQISLQPGDKLLLCSDGLTNMIEDMRIAQILMTYSGAKACDVLINEANNAGGTDNITAVLME